MSAFDYYKQKGFTPTALKFRTISNAAVATTITIWTPASGYRIALTNLTIAKGASAGTIAFYFAGTALHLEEPIAEFAMAGSTTIYPGISGWETTAADVPLVVRVSTGETNGWAVTAEGFELN